MVTHQAIERQPEKAVAEVERTRNQPCYRPNVDILETADEVRVIADMPGMGPRDVDIRFENGTLTIEGSVQPRGDANAAYLRREYGVGDFYRTFQVGEAIDAERITAEYHEGVLTLHLPKTEAAKPRKIEVKTG